jgi:hypothetical protein
VIVTNGWYSVIYIHFPRREDHLDTSLDPKSEKRQVMVEIAAIHLGQKVLKFEVRSDVTLNFFDRKISVQSFHYSDCPA